MNLNDYHKFARMMFRDNCDLEELLDLIESVWDSGRRSGAASSADREKKICSFGEWKWGPTDGWDLAAYAQRVAPDGTFPCRDDAVAFVREQQEAMREWAEAKGERKVDWKMALKGWIRRTLQTAPRIHGPRQPGLFGPNSQPPSKTSNEVHEETFRTAVELNSRRVPPSQWSTSSATGLPETPAGALSSSRTRRPYH